MKNLSSLLILLFSAALATPVAGQFFPNFDASKWFYSDPQPDTETYWKQTDGIDIVHFDQHLERFTKEDTQTIRAYYQRSGNSPLYNFRPPGLSPEILTKPDNSFDYPIIWNGVFYFTITSQKEPACELIIAYTSRDIPATIKTFWRCAN